MIRAALILVLMLPGCGEVFDAPQKPEIKRGNFIVSVKESDDAAAVTKSDTVTFESSVLYVEGTGNVKVDTAQGTPVTFTAVLAGAVLPLRVCRVWSADTPATNMIRVF